MYAAVPLWEGPYHAQNEVSCSEGWIDVSTVGDLVGGEGKEGMVAVLTSFVASPFIWSQGDQMFKLPGGRGKEVAPPCSFVLVGIPQQFLSLPGQALGLVNNSHFHVRGTFLAAASVLHLQGAVCYAVYLRAGTQFLCPPCSPRAKLADFLRL